MSSTPEVEIATPDDEDVIAEETTVKNQVTESNLLPSIAVQIRGLRKTYAGTTNIGCCKCKRTPPYHAVKVITKLMVGV